MFNTGDVICPICGGLVEEFDTIDTWIDSNSATLLKVGKCDQCGKNYQWREEYTYTGYLNLEQISDDDEPADIDDDCGFDPYIGCYTGDC